MQTALAALTGVGSPQVYVDGPNGGPYRVIWTGSLAGASQSAMTANGASLTGGAGTVTPVHTQTGGGQVIDSLRTPVVTAIMNAILTLPSAGVAVAGMNWWVGPGESGVGGYTYLTAGSSGSYTLTNAGLAVGSFFAALRTAATRTSV